MTAALGSQAPREGRAVIELRVSDCFITRLEVGSVCAHPQLSRRPLIDPVCEAYALSAVYRTSKSLTLEERTAPRALIIRSVLCS